MGRSERLATVAWFLFWALLSTFWCWSAGHAIGATYDEPFYIQAGLKNWRHLYHRELLTQGTMPLPAEVQTFPLFLAEIVSSADPGGDLDGWLPVARMGTIVFWWLLLWSAHRLGSWYGGLWAGRLGVALLACEPILLGHASLATADIPFTACLLALMASFLHRRNQPAWSARLMVPAVWCMLTILSKASALVFVPACLGTIELDRLWRTGWRPGRSLASWKPAFSALRDLALLGFIGIALVFAVCPRASRGLLFQIHHNAAGHGGSFLLGEASPTGFPHYFLMALAIKLGLPVFLLLATVLVTRPRLLCNGVLVVALALLALTPGFHVQIGVRLVLPIAVLLIVGSATAFAAWLATLRERWTRYSAYGAFAALLLWSQLGAYQAWPHEICYTNEVWGGTSEGFRALADSNYDWGQGLKDLAQWQRRHAETPLNVCYWGTDPALHRLPVHPVPLDRILTSDEMERANRGCFLAVSTNFCIADLPHLRAMTPWDRTMTFLIYDFRDRKLAAGQ